MKRFIPQGFGSLFKPKDLVAAGFVRDANVARGYSDGILGNVTIRTDGERTLVRVGARYRDFGHNQTQAVRLAARAARLMACWGTCPAKSAIATRRREEAYLMRELARVRALLRLDRTATRDPFEGWKMIDGTPIKQE
jgi:hypothetical protein